MSTNRWITFSQRVYRWLLRLYPQAYRTSYESEMFNLFTDQCRDAYRGQGRSGILTLWLRTLVDIGVTAVREHLSDPQAGIGLFDITPNAVLPWKGVLLVLIPGLIFFVSQIEQVTSDNDWFFLVLHRAAYFLILPVLLAWLLTRRFPIWGLIPLGLLYGTLGRYSPDSLFSKLSSFGASNSLIPFEKIYGLGYFITVPACAVLLCSLIWYTAHRRQISRAAWKWLQLYGLLITLQIAAEVYRFMASQKLYFSPDELKEYLYLIPLWHLYDSLPFLLLVFIGVLFARKYGGFSFLLLLGYLLPTVIFGRYSVWNDVVPFYAVSLAVVIYRFVVGLVAPVWLVRAASVKRRQRAAAIPVVMAIVCHVSLNLIVFLGWASQSGSQINLMDLTLSIWRQVIIAAGLGLAVALYLPGNEHQPPVSPPPLAAAME